MNAYIDAQRNHIITMVKSFEQSCRMAATKNDGTIDRAEEKTLKKIQKATERFAKELSKIK